MHVYSEVGPAIEVIKWDEKPDYFFGVDAEAVPSSVLLRCTSMELAPGRPKSWRTPGFFVLYKALHEFHGFHGFRLPVPSYDFYRWHHTNI